MHIHTSISIFIQKLKSKPKTIEYFYKSQLPPSQPIKIPACKLTGYTEKDKNQTSISNITQPEPDMEHIQKVQYILFAEKPSHL